MSQKHWTFTNIIRYIEEYERNPLLIERMKWKSIPEGEFIVEFVKLCEHLVLERTIDPKNHQATAIYLRYSLQLLLKKKRAKKPIKERQPQNILKESIKNQAIRMCFTAGILQIT